MITEGRSLRAVVVTVLLVLVLAISSCGTSEADGQVTVVDPAEAVRLLATEKYVVLDLRPSGAFEAAHVHGARNMPYSSAGDFEARVAGLETSESYLLYARSEKDADAAADQLVALGFERVVDGGSFGLLALAGAVVE